MIKIIDKNMCSGCGACYSICPVQCIKMVEDDEGFLYPFVEEDKCINCGLCETKCEFLKKETINNEICKCFGVKNNDLNDRKSSSSGGVFSLLAKNVIKKGGVVFGAAFSEDREEVRHIKISKIEELEKIKSSKYMQSVIHNIYKDVEKSLNIGLPVLFSGTPCQISALKNYLGKEYDSLFCVEVICHGVPSSKLWRMYLQFIFKKINNKHFEVNFRDKNKGWSDYNLCLKDGDNLFYESHSKNKYMNLFLRNYSLRPSCYNCKAKENGSKADIILGDFWGINSINPEFDDDFGVSAVIVYTTKGLSLYNQIKKDVTDFNTTYNDIYKYNSCLKKTVNSPYERKKFYIDLNNLPFKKFLNKYSSKYSIFRIYCKLKQNLFK